MTAHGREFLLPQIGWEQMYYMRKEEGLDFTHQGYGEARPDPAFRSGFLYRLYSGGSRGRPDSTDVWARVPDCLWN